MGSESVSGVGGVLSADIAVPRHDEELAFYARVLTTGRAPLWRDDLTNNHGTPVIGLGPRAPEYEHLPLQWMPHVQVADVAASAARAVECGGTELMHGGDEDGRSQWAVLVDPMGAAFGVIPVVGAEVEAAYASADAGGIRSLTLVVPDAASTCEFYERVVGWSSVATGIDGAIRMHRPDGSPAAEICQQRGATADVPPVWLLGLPVDDLGESLRQARAGGGEVIEGSVDAGRAVIRDPVGVHLALQARE